MHIAGRPKIHFEFHEATSYFGSHMGTCYHRPAYAEAWLSGNRGGAVIVEQADMTPEQATAKAVALVR